MWDLIVSVPDHCLSFYFSVKNTCQETDIITFAHVCVTLYKIYESHRERTSKFAVKDVRKHLLPSN